MKNKTPFKKISLNVIYIFKKAQFWVVVPFGQNSMCRALGHTGRKQISTLGLSNEERSSSASGPAVI